MFAPQVRAPRAKATVHTTKTVAAKPAENTRRRPGAAVSNQVMLRLLPQTAAPHPAWVQRCGIGSSCGCGQQDKLAGVHDDLQRATAGGGSPLPSAIRADMEQAFSSDFSSVRVHTGAAADEVASRLHAHALTAGNDILFRLGAYRPGTPAGNRLMAHELTHVVQQVAGLPRAAVDHGPADPLERAAEDAAEAAGQGLVIVRV